MKSIREKTNFQATESSLDSVLLSSDSSSPTWAMSSFELWPRSDKSLDAVLVAMSRDKQSSALDAKPSCTNASNPSAFKTSPMGLANRPFRTWLSIYLDRNRQIASRFVFCSEARPARWLLLRGCCRGLPAGGTGAASVLLFTLSTHQLHLANKVVWMSSSASVRSLTWPGGVWSFTASDR